MTRMPTLLRSPAGTGLLHVSGVSRAQRSLIEVHGSRARSPVDGNTLQSAREPGKFEPVDVTPLAARASGVMTGIWRNVARCFEGKLTITWPPSSQGIRVQTVMEPFTSRRARAVRVDLVSPSGRQAARLAMGVGVVGACYGP